jgi:hypothetical protein
MYWGCVVSLLKVCFCSVKTGAHPFLYALLLPIMTRVLWVLCRIHEGYYGVFVSMVVVEVFFI